jgi:hypothetical protein
MPTTPVATRRRFQLSLSLRVFELTFDNSTSKTPRLKDSKKHQQHDTPGTVVAGVMCIAQFLEIRAPVKVAVEAQAQAAPVFPR